MALGYPSDDSSNGNPLLAEYNRTGVVPPALQPVLDRVKQKIQALGTPIGQEMPPGGQPARPTPTLRPPQPSPPPLTNGAHGDSSGIARPLLTVLSSPHGGPPLLALHNHDTEASGPSPASDTHSDSSAPLPLGLNSPQPTSRSAAPPASLQPGKSGSPVAGGAVQSGSQEPAPSISRVSDVPRAVSQQQPTALLSAGGNPTPAKDEYNRLVKTGSGIDQIHNPWARNSLHVLDAIGSQFFPGLAMGIRGTQLHHNMLVRQAAGNVNEEQNVAEKEAQTRNYNAEAAEKENPAAKPKAITNEFEKWMADNPNGKLEDWEKFKADHLKAVQAATPFEKWAKDNPNGKVEDWLKLEQTLKPSAEKEGEMPLGPRVPQINQALAARYQVLHRGQALPAYYTLPENATQKDAERISNLLKDEEGAQGTKAQRDQAQQNHQDTMAILAQTREKKDETVTKTAALKAYTPALDSAERFNVMAKNYEDAVRNHDQQAMLSLLANHLGMTMGLQKGARMNKDIIKEAEQSRPWLQGMKASFDKDGYLSGVNLTPEQMRQMVNLGRERFSEDIAKGRSEAGFQGYAGEGPERTPNKATVNHYVSLANGDRAKAKQLLAEDGWSVGK